MPATTHVLASDERLREALLTWLAQVPGISAATYGEGATLQPGDFVVAAASNCSPEACRQLTTSGCKVVVLMPVVRSSDHRQYTEAGATACLAMGLDLSELTRAIRVHD